MADKIFNILHNASVSMANVKVKNAMNPLIHVIGWIGSMSVSMMIFGVVWIQIIGAVIFISLIISALIAYFYFMFKNPQMLQSEEFQIKKQALEIIQQQGMVGQIAIEDTFAISSENNQKLLSERSAV